MSEPTIITLGCRLNAYESEVMRDHALAAGLDDAVIINTCAVTAEAVRQAAQTIRKLRRERPSARIIVTGCAAQIEPERFAEMAEVDEGRDVHRLSRYRPAWHRLVRARAG
jgi:threonylcarbamoyladenosine tRNA methylthiotransferase MtaB